MSNPDTQAERLERNTYRISLATGIVLAIVSIISLISTIQTGLYAFLGIIVTALISIAAFISAWLGRRHRPGLGSTILLGSILVISLSLPVMAKGQGLALGIMVAVLVSGIATATLAPAAAGRASSAALAVGVIITLVDLYTPSDFGTPTDPRITIPVAVVMSIGYGIVILTRFRNFSLRTKLIISFIGVTILPLAVLGYQSYQTTDRLLRSQTDTKLLNLASLSADSVDTFIQTQLDSVRTEAQIIDLLDYLKLPASQRANSLEEARAIKILQSFQRKDPIFITSYALLDLKGIDVIDTFVDDIGLDKSNRDYFIKPMLINGLPYVSQVTISPNYDVPSLYFSAPVRDQYGATWGILRVRYSASILQRLITTTLKADEVNEYALLVDTQYHIRLAHSSDPSLNFKSYTDLTPAQAVELQKEGRLALGSYNDVVGPMPETVNAVNAIDDQPTFTAPGSAFGGIQTLSAGMRLKTIPTWVAVVRESEAEALLPVVVQTRNTIMLSMLIAGLAAVAALVIAQVLSNPIIHLASIAGQVASGNLSARAKVNTVDEVGNLASTFNTMTDTLQTTLTGLEQRVDERTADLQQATLQSEKRARDLQTISEVSGSIATEQKTERLLPLVARLVSEKFGFYHVGIFLLDSSRRYAVLQATNSEGGWRMLKRGHKLEVGISGIVGRVAQTGNPRIALDVGEDATFFNNPELPATHSEMALPLKARGEIIGVLDVQSTEEAAFSQTDVNTLGILADQVAIAIENARLFSEVQRTLAETQALYGQYVGQEWSRQAAKRAQVGYQQTLAGGKPVEELVQSEEIRQAMEKGEIVVRAPTGQAENLPTLTIPLKVREQTIGVLNVRLPRSDKKWEDTEINMVRSISERVTLALENARLYQDAQRRAARERSISEISSKISTAADIDAILRSTVEELGKSLGNAEVAIQIGDDSVIKE